MSQIHKVWAFCHACLSLFLMFSWAEGVSIPHNNLAETHPPSALISASFGKARRLFWLVLSGQVAYFSSEIWQRRHPEKQICVAWERLRFGSHSAAARASFIHLSRLNRRPWLLGVRGRACGCNHYISARVSSSESCDACWQTSADSQALSDRVTKTTHN